MREFGIEVGGDAAFDEALGDGLVVEADEFGVVVFAEDDADIDLAFLGGDEFLLDDPGGEVGVLEVDAFAALADCGDEGVLDFGDMRAGFKNADSNLVVSEFFAEFLRDKEGDGPVASSALVTPGAVKVVLQGGDDGPLDTGHEVVPIVAVFVGDVHAAEESGLSIDDDDLGVVGGEEGVAGFADADFALVGFEVVDDGVSSAEGALGGFFLIPPGSEGAEFVHEDAAVDLGGDFFEKVRVAGGDLVVAENIDAGLDGFGGVANGVVQGREEGFSVDEVIDIAGNGGGEIEAVEGGFDGFRGGIASGGNVIGEGAGEEEGPVVREGETFLNGREGIADGGDDASLKDDMIDDIDGEAAWEFLFGLIEQEGTLIGTARAENE